MKNVKKALPVIASAFLSLSLLVGCAKNVVVNTDDLMLDIDVQPTQVAAYEEYSKQAFADYLAVADKHIKDGEVDTENEEVVDAARTAAAKLFAYACYNERTLDKYVFFASQEGDTSISAGSATALRQEYYLRINETENTCGYRYHYTIKKVMNSTGAISTLKSLFESARTRITDKTDLLYRFEGASDIKVGANNEVLGVDMLECDWKTGKDWGKPDIKIVKGEYIEPDKIEEDIVNSAGEDNITMRANINILAEDIVKSALIIKDGNDAGLEESVIVMHIDTDVANRDDASLKMLRKANGSDDCRWVSEEDESGLSIVFRLWGNGLFRMYSVSEKWQGKISGFSGSANSSTVYNYSYSDRDCDMARYLEILEKAKAEKGD